MFLTFSYAPLPTPASVVIYANSHAVGPGFYLSLRPKFVLPGLIGLRLQLVLLLISLFFSFNAAGNLPQNPLSLSLGTNKVIYREGETIVMSLTISNTSAKLSFPVFLPLNDAAARRLFRLRVFDKANNSSILRYGNERGSDSLFTDTASIVPYELKPLEQKILRFSFNGAGNSSVQPEERLFIHDLGLPLFAGVYKVALCYDPKGIPAADRLYCYSQEFNTVKAESDFPCLPEAGLQSQLAGLKIKRQADSLIEIAGQTFFIKTDGYLYFYFTEKKEKISTDETCMHITNLPSDSCSLPSREYFYNYFKDRFAEYIARFDDGDLREYRRFRNECPDDLYTEQYNENKEKIRYACHLPNGMYYEIRYRQPDGRIIETWYCSDEGTTCTQSVYVYNKKGEFVKIRRIKTQMCLIVEVDGKRMSSAIGINLEDEALKPRQGQ